MEHANTTEKIGTGLVCSLETYKGANIQLVKRLSGFNGLSVYKDGEVRKIEIKTMQNSDKWIAVNGAKAINKLFFENDYWFYFVLYPENIVIVTKALLFMEAQFEFHNANTYLDDLKQWLMLSKKLTLSNKFKYTTKINVSFPIPIRQLYTNFDKYKEQFQESIKEIWQNKGGWQLIYQSTIEEL